MDEDEDTYYPVFDREVQPQRPVSHNSPCRGPDLDLSPSSQPSPGVPPRRYSNAPQTEDYASDESEDWEETWGLEDTSSPEQEEDKDAHYGYSLLQKKTFFGTSQVTSLNSQSFYNFIGGNEKAMVMFYNPFQCESVFPGLNFRSAASVSTNRNHAYAGVDCSVQKELCLKEQALKLPIFKLYSNGFSVSTVRDTKNFNADQIRMLVTMTPVLTQPRQELAKTFLARC